MRAGEHLLHGIPADAVEAQLDAGVRHVRHRDGAVPHLARRAALPLLQDAIEEVGLVPVVVLRLVDERVRLLEVLPGEVLQLVGHHHLAGLHADVALLRVPHGLARDAVLLIDLHHVDAYAVRVDEVERERLRPAEHRALVVGEEIALHVLHAHRSGKVRAEAALDLVELVRAEVRDHAVAVALVEAPAGGFVDGRDERVVLPVLGGTLPEVPRLGRHPLRKRRALLAAPVAHPVVAAGDRDESARDLAAVAVEGEHLGEDVVGVAAPLVAGLERDARLLRDLRHRLALGDGERHRLLAEDVLAGLHRGDGDDGVPVVGRADADGVDRRVVHHVAPVEHLAARLVAVVVVDHVLDDRGSAHVARHLAAVLDVALEEVGLRGALRFRAVEVARRDLHHVARHGHAAARVLQEPGHVRALRDHAAADHAHVHLRVGGNAARRRCAAAKQAPAPAEERQRKRARHELSSLHRLSFRWDDPASITNYGIMRA